MDLPSIPKKINESDDPPLKRLKMAKNIAFSPKNKKVPRETSNPRTAHAFLLRYFDHISTLRFNISA